MDRPTIIVDLDNVVYDFVMSIAEWLDNNNVLNATDAYRAYSQWAFWNDWGMTKGELFRWWRLGIESGYIYGQGPVIDNARDALWKLSDAEWNIHLVTNRLTSFGLHDTIVDNTSRWLRTNNIPYRELSFASDKHRILADAIVDDRSDNMNPKVHGKVFHFYAPHNRMEPTDKWEWESIIDALL